MYNESGRKAFQNNDSDSSNFFIRQVIKEDNNIYESNTGDIAKYIDISNTDYGAFENYYINIDSYPYHYNTRIYTNDLSKLKPYGLANNSENTYKSSTNRIILKAMVKYYYLTTTENSYTGQNKLSNTDLGPQIIFNGKIEKNGTGF